jgi:serine/threonine protein phosphatase PrpC
LKFSHLFKGKGDFNGPYIKTEPDIKIFAIKNKFERIVLASDGVWDFLNKNVVAESSF